MDMSVRKTLANIFRQQEADQKEEKETETREVETVTEVAENEEETQETEVVETANETTASADIVAAIRLQVQTLKAENKDLKKKAEQWDAYQKALDGTRPKGDLSAGEVETLSDVDRLKAKYPNLMEGL